MATTTAPVHHVRDKQIRGLLARAVAQGFTVRMRTSKHLGVYAPDGAFAGHVGCTPGDHRVYRNLRAQLRRAGYTGA